MSQRKVRGTMSYSLLLHRMLTILKLSNLANISETSIQKFFRKCYSYKNFEKLFKCSPCH